MKALPRSELRAFTLIELIAAVGIFVSISIVLVSLSGQMANLWSFNESRSQTREKARAALESIRRELGQAVLPLDPAQNDGPYLEIQAGTAGGSSRGSALYFTIPVSSQSDPGDLAQVGYLVSGNNLLRAMLKCPDGKPASVADLIAASPADAENDYQGLFLQGVAGCWIAAYDATGAATTDWNSRNDDGLPRRLALSLVVMDDHLTQRVESNHATLPDPSDSPDAEDYLNGLDAEIAQRMAIVTISMNFDLYPGSSSPTSSP